MQSRERRTHSKYRLNSLPCCPALSTTPASCSYQSFKLELSLLRHGLARPGRGFQAVLVKMTSVVTSRHDSECFDSFKILVVHFEYSANDQSLAASTATCIVFPGARETNFHHSFTHSFYAAPSLCILQFCIILPLSLPTVSAKRKTSVLRNNSLILQ